MITPEESTGSIICFNNSDCQLVSRPVDYQRINAYINNILILYVQVFCKSMGKGLMTPSIWNKQLVQNNTEDPDNQVGHSQESLKTP